MKNREIAMLTPLQKKFLNLAKGGHKEKLNGLLAQNPDLDILVIKDAAGNTALHWAAINNDVETFYFLLDLLEKQITTKNPDTPTKFQQEDSKREITEEENKAWQSDTVKINVINSFSDLFIPPPKSSKVDYVFANQEGKTPWHIAAEKGFKKFFEKPSDQTKLLFWQLLHKHWLNYGDQQENTVLHLAVCYKKGNKRISDKKSIVESLLQQPGLYINAKNTQGDTPLHGAAENGCLRTLEVLLNSNKYPIIATLKVAERNKDNNTALDSALRNGHQTIAILLLRRVDSISAKTLTVAANNPNLDNGIFSKLLEKCIASEAEVDMAIEQRIQKLVSTTKYKIVISSIIGVLCPTITLAQLLLNPDLWQQQQRIILPVLTAILFPLFVSSLAWSRYQSSMRRFDPVSAEAFNLLWQTIEKKTCFRYLTQQLAQLYESVEEFQKQYFPKDKEDNINITHDVIGQFKAFKSAYENLQKLLAEPGEIKLKYLDQSQFDEIEKFSDFDPSENSEWTSFKDQLAEIGSLLADIFCPTGAAISIFYLWLKTVQEDLVNKDTQQNIAGFLINSSLRESIETLVTVGVASGLGLLLKKVSYDTTKQSLADKERKLMAAYHDYKSIDLSQIQQIREKIEPVLQYLEQRMSELVMPEHLTMETSSHYRAISVSSNLGTNNTPSTSASSSANQASNKPSCCSQIIRFLAASFTKSWRTSSAPVPQTGETQRLLDKEPKAKTKRCTCTIV